MEACSFRFTIVIPILFRGGIVTEIGCRELSNILPISLHSIAGCTCKILQKLVVGEIQVDGASKARRFF